MDANSAAKPNSTEKTKDKAVQIDWSTFSEIEKSQTPIGSFSNVDEKELDSITPEKLLAFRHRESNLLGHLGDYRKRTEELRRKLSLREMHIERLEEELLRNKEMLVECRGKERELQHFIADMRMTIDDLHEKYDEQFMLSQLKDSEHSQTVAELERRVKEFESKKYATLFEKNPKIPAAKHFKNHITGERNAHFVPKLSTSASLTALNSSSNFVCCSISFGESSRSLNLDLPETMRDAIVDLIKNPIKRGSIAEETFKRRSGSIYNDNGSSNGSLNSSVGSKAVSDSEVTSCHENKTSADDKRSAILKGLMDSID